MPQTAAVGVSVRCPLRISYGGTKGTPKKNDRESKKFCFVNFRRGSHGVTWWMRRAKESRRALRRSASISLTISGMSELATAAMYSSVRRCHTPLDKNFCQWNLNSQWRGRSPCSFFCSNEILPEFRRNFAGIRQIFRNVRSLTSLYFLFQNLSRRRPPGPPGPPGLP